MLCLYLRLPLQLAFKCQNVSCVYREIKLDFHYKNTVCYPHIHIYEL